MKILVEVNQAFTNKCFFLSLVNKQNTYIESSVGTLSCYYNYKFQA
jgi:hypothetical protein